MKKQITRLTASTMLKLPILEKSFCYLCSQSILRKYLHLGAFAYGCVNVLKQQEIRIADLKTYRMYVNISEPLGIQSYFFRENPAIWLTSELISAGDVCIDAGANMGHYTFLMASKVGSSGKVISFEPQPQYFSIIQDSIQLNGYESFVVVDNKALWEKTGEILKFYLSENPNNSGTSSLINHGLYLNEETNIEVKTITLCDYVKELNIQKIRLIKIDVERADLQVLLGMESLLVTNMIDYIILEMYAHSQSQELLQKLGYTCFLIDAINKKLIDVGKVSKNHFGDYIFVSEISLNELQFQKVLNQSNYSNTLDKYCKK
jgi:FkbM family methyltransferase